MINLKKILEFLKSIEIPDDDIFFEEEQFQNILDMIEIEFSSDFPIDIDYLEEHMNANLFKSCNFAFSGPWVYISF